VQIPGNAAHTDFAASYASAALFREGHAAMMFDPAAQSGVLHAAGGGASSTTSPAALTPAAILVLVPLTAPIKVALLDSSVPREPIRRRAGIGPDRSASVMSS
jgi:hypothetical protein